MGATDLGGLQYFIGSGGARMKTATNGGVGYYEDYNYTEWKYFFDDEGNLRRSPTIVASQRFVAAAQQVWPDFNTLWSKYPCNNVIAVPFIPTRGTFKFANPGYK